MSQDKDLELYVELLSQMAIEDVTTSDNGEELEDGPRPFRDARRKKKKKKKRSRYS